jgi:hypothetical protein
LTVTVLELSSDREVTLDRAEADFFDHYRYKLIVGNYFDWRILEQKRRTIELKIKKLFCFGLPNKFKKI